MILIASFITEKSKDSPKSTASYKRKLFVVDFFGYVCYWNKPDTLISYIF